MQLCARASAMAIHALHGSLVKKDSLHSPVESLMSLCNSMQLPKHMQAL